MEVSLFDTVSTSRVMCTRSPLRISVHYLVAIVHDVMYCDQSLVCDHPVSVLGAFYQQVGQLGDGDIWLVGTLDQVCKQSKQMAQFTTHPAL